MDRASPAFCEMSAERKRVNGLVREGLILYRCPLDKLVAQIDTNQNLTDTHILISADAFSRVSMHSPHQSDGSPEGCSLTHSSSGAHVTASGR